jgi:hypothetical protein
MAEDSEKTSGPLEEKPAVTEELVLHAKSQDFVKANRKKNGQFAKKDRAMPPTREITHLMRTLLNQAETGPDGHIVKGSQSRFRKMFNKLFEIATCDFEQPVTDKLGNAVMVNGKPLTVKDPKIMMAVVQAQKEMMLRAHGDPSKNEAEVEAMQQHGVRIVVIQPPAEMMNRDVVEDAPRPALKPAFIEGEFVTEDKK